MLAAFPVFTPGITKLKGKNFAGRTVRHSEQVGSIWQYDVAIDVRVSSYITNGMGFGSIQRTGVAVLKLFWHLFADRQ
jgi:hypothetical protein